MKGRCSGNLPFTLGAAKVSGEPYPVIVILCCARSQREKCGRSENCRAVARRKNRSLVGSAAWFKCRIYGSRTLLPLSARRLCRYSREGGGQWGRSSDRQPVQNHDQGDQRGENAPAPGADLQQPARCAVFGRTNWSLAQGAMGRRGFVPIATNAAPCSEV